MFPSKFAGVAKMGFYAAMVSCFCSVASQAATISGLFNTGVDGAGVAFGSGGVPDPHYSLIVQPLSATAVTVTDTGFPFPIWVANNSGSRWIGPDETGPDATGNATPGNYVYRTTFNVPANADLSTVNVSGLWGTDDPSVDILINGASTGNVSAGFTTLVPFSVNSGFVIGTNTLDFSLNNVISVTGLRVDKIVGTYLVPEPATACLGSLALAMSTAVLVRMRAKR